MTMNHLYWYSKENVSNKRGYFLSIFAASIMITYIDGLRISSLIIMKNLNSLYSIHVDYCANCDYGYQPRSYKLNQHAFQSVEDVLRKFMLFLENSFLDELTWCTSNFSAHVSKTSIIWLIESMICCGVSCRIISWISIRWAKRVVNSL